MASVVVAQSHFMCNSSALFDFDAEDEEMGNGLHDVRRKVGLDDTLATEAANASLRFIPIGTIQDERDEFLFLER